MEFHLGWIFLGSRSRRYRLVSYCCPEKLATGKKESGKSLAVP